MQTKPPVPQAFVHVGEELRRGKFLERPHDRIAPLGAFVDHAAWHPVLIGDDQANQLGDKLDRQVSDAVVADPSILVDQHVALSDDARPGHLGMSSSGSVERLGGGHELSPRASRMNVHFDHARIRGDTQHFQARIARRRITFDDDR